MTGGFGSAVLEALEEARLADPALRARPGAAHRHPRRPLRRPRLGDRPAAAHPARRARHHRAGARGDRAARDHGGGRRPELIPGAARGSRRTSAVSRLRHDRRMPTTTARRIRLDQLLVERGLAPTRTRAQALRARRPGPRGRGRRRPPRPQGGDLVDRSTASIEVAGGRQCVTRGGAQAARGARRVRHRPGGPCRARRRRLDRRLHRRAAASAARRASTLSTWATDSSPRRCARDPRVVSMERTNARDARPPATLPEPVGPRGHRRLVHLARASCWARCARCCATGGADRRPGQAAVRGRHARDAQGRRRARPARSTAAVLRATAARAAGAGPRDARRHPVADPRPGGQPRVPRPGSRPGPSARTSTRGSTPRSPRPGRTRRDRRADRLRVQPHQRGRARAPRAGGRLVPDARHRALGGAGRRDGGSSIELLPGTDVARRARRRRHVPARRAGGRRGRRARSWASTWARSASCPRPRPSELEAVLEQLMDGPFTIRERMGLDRRRSCPGWPRRRTRRSRALNDIVVARGSLARVVRLDVSDRRVAPRDVHRRRPRGRRARPARPATRSAPAARSSTRTAATSS